MTDSAFAIEPLLIACRRRELAAQQQHRQALDACQKAEKQLQDAVLEQESGCDLMGRELARGISAGELGCLRHSCFTQETRRRECEMALTGFYNAVSLAEAEMAAAALEREALNRFQEDVYFVPVWNLHRKETEVFNERPVFHVGASEVLQLFAVEMA